MSGMIVGAVLRRGPKNASLRFTLVAFAENADDFGFAQIPQETVASKVLKDLRTVSRHVTRLSRDGWILPVRRPVEGCGNVYFLNLPKLEVKTPSESKKSPYHRGFLLKIGNDWDGPDFSTGPCGKPGFPHDTGDVDTRQKSEGHTTKIGETHDKTILVYKEDSLLTRCYPLLTPLVVERDDGDGENLQDVRSNLPARASPQRCSRNRRHPQPNRVTRRPGA